MIPSVRFAESRTEGKEKGEKKHNLAEIIVPFLDREKLTQRQFALDIHVSEKTVYRMLYEGSVSGYVALAAAFRLAQTYDEYNMLIVKMLPNLGIKMTEEAFYQAHRETDGMNSYLTRLMEAFKQKNRY